MVIVLPDKKDGLAELEEKLSSTDLQDLCEKGHDTKVEVQLPRFKMEYSTDLVDTLKTVRVTFVHLCGRAYA